MNKPQRADLYETPRNGDSKGQPRYLEQLPGNSGWRPTGHVQINDAYIHQNTAKLTGLPEPSTTKLRRGRCPNKLRRAPPSSSEPPQGIDVDRGGHVILPLTQRGDEQTHKRLDHA
ncbi:hypothetical protein HZ326_6452 [Fusarium oxysporum f. sp. albedinis]|nr:hypothetical protein HZ326_6452 [Fusarium oxysporum f. sp. albedinis]